MHDFKQQALDQHKKLAGKLSIKLKDNLDTVEKLNIYYTPGVAAVSEHLAANPKDANQYTWKRNLVAVISDGSAVLGLGKIGPLGALPVMEGKSMLFKQFADIDSVPIVLDASNADEVIATVKAIAPSFGGINLEDIRAPECFYIESVLKDELDIPIFHDDQHGTAIVVLAGLLNAAKVTNRDLRKSKVLILGAGAAGSATAKLLTSFGIANVIVFDSKGAIASLRSDLTDDKKLIAKITNPSNITGDPSENFQNADIVIGLSRPGMITTENIQQMNKNSIVFAMANPIPEIYPDKARQAGAAVIATGRSDFPNQVNNAIAFPGIFRGALDNNVKRITDEHKLAAAQVIANLVDQPAPEHIIPNLMDPRLVTEIASVVK